ncbi:MAG: hypothetical protein C5S52_05750 [ANME-2 cluster archaeon]|nr:hypothetical protein [ANME-2 cluster archaeon]
MPGHIGCGIDGSLLAIPLSMDETVNPRGCKPTQGKIAKARSGVRPCPGMARSRMLL